MTQVIRGEENMEIYFNRKEIFLENFLHLNVKPGQFHDF